MIAMLARRLALTLVVVLVALAFLEHFNPVTPAPIADFHHADYPLCVTVRPPPLQPRSSGIILYPHRSDQV